MLKLLSVPGKYVSRTTTSRLERKVKTIETTKCVSLPCENRVICRCTICSEYLCYEHTQTHPHAMTNFEVLK